jgi:hypothetical protein
MIQRGGTTRAVEVGALATARIEAIRIETSIVETAVQTIDGLDPVLPMTINYRCPG